MKRLIVEGVTADKDGVFEVPDEYTTIGAFYHPANGILNLVVIKDAPMITPPPVMGPETKLVDDKEKKPDGK